MSATLRWGMLGVSDYLLRYAVPGLQEASGCELTHVGVRDIARARTKLSGALPGADLVEPYEALLENRAIDVVYITLPNALHVEMTLAALAAGKHVLCEKPLTTHPSDVARVAAAARDRGLSVMEAYMYRFHPQWEIALKTIRDGVIGTVQTVLVQYAYLDADYAGPRFDPNLDGGVLRMVGCYPLDIVCLLFDARPVAVSALSRPAPGDNSAVDVTTSAIVEFPAGHGVVTASVEAYDTQYVRVVGTRGAIELDMPVNPPRDTTMHVQVTTEEGARTIDVPAADQFQLEFEAFARAVRERLPMPVPLKQTETTAAVLQAAAESAAEHGRRIALSEPTQS
jgi:predicted dehydrogenase